MNNKELYIVHCVDSEGPLYEDINATFQRVENLGVNLNDYERNDASSNTRVAGYANTTSAIDAIQFKMSSGNIDSGTIEMYGIN